MKKKANVKKPASKAKPTSPWKLQQAYIIRTVTHYYTGRLTEVYPDSLVLTEAAWIADTGRFYNALKTGLLNEVEPIIGPVIISRGAVVDGIEWHHALPHKQL